MLRRRSAWLAAMLVGAALIAGCGGSSSKSSTTTPSTGSTASSSTASTPSSTSTPGLTGAAREEAIKSCKSSIRSAKTLPSSAKTKLEGVCEKAANGDLNAVRTAAREICEEVVKNAGVPAGAQREAALRACKAK
jgi:hypothetical protein